MPDILPSNVEDEETVQTTNSNEAMKIEVVS